MSRTATPPAARIDVVFIRKSSDSQDEKGQIDTVTTHLRSRSIYVPDPRWFVCTISRAKVQESPEFQRLMQAVRANRVGTVYIESQDRWGTNDRIELFTLLGELRKHGTRLFDLSTNRDLTAEDFTTELLAVLNSYKSEQERDDLARRSLRSRVSRHLEGSWATGSQPFGFGKRCIGTDGRVLWEWIPRSRSKRSRISANEQQRGGRGDLFKIVNGVPTLTDQNVPIPTKTKGIRERTVLIPGMPEHVKAVRRVFDLYASQGLSRRAIAKALNAEGLRHYEKPFSPTMVTQILTNPAYVGDTHFGKVQMARHQTFDRQGLPVRPESKGFKRRPVAERLVVKDSHEALVDRKTWDLAEKRLAKEKPRHSLTSVNPAYYLRSLLVCGHCGKQMSGRTEIHRDTREKRVGYVCAQYLKGFINGQPVTCGYHFIPHADAEALLFRKLEELGVEFRTLHSEGGRDSLNARLAKLGHESEAFAEQWEQWVKEGTSALLAYLKREFSPNSEAIRKLERMASWFYQGAKLSIWRWEKMPLSREEFKRAVDDAEREVTDHAKAKIKELTEEHKTYTRSWLRASPEMQAVMKEDLERIEEQLRQWKARAVPLSERMQELYEAETQRERDRAQLLAEWPDMHARERGESLRRFFNTVTLFWTRTFQPASDRPTRPRKTDRAGRFRFKLDLDRIQWSFATSELNDSW